MTEESIRVLLVQPEGAPARRLVELLSSSRSSGRSLDLVQIPTIAAACERLTEDSFDLVLLDLAIPDEPGLDGFIRLNAQLPETPVVVIASAGTEGMATAALEAGAADSLVRSAFEKEPVDDVLFAVIQRSRFQQAIRRRALIEESTGVYSREGFLQIGRKHLSLASHGGKGLLVGSFDLQGAARGTPDSIIQAGAAILKRSFRNSDVVAHLAAGRFATLSIVNPGDDSAAIVETRLREQIHDHNALHPESERLWFVAGMMRLAPGGDASPEAVLDNLPPADRRLE